MSKIVSSPAKRFMGEIALPDYLTWPQYLEWQNAKEAAAKFLQTRTLGEGEQRHIEYFYRYQDIHPLYIPAICKIVAQWKLQNFPNESPSLETFPATKASAKLVEWLISEIEALWQDENDIPNASTPQAINMPAATEMNTVI